MQGLTNYPCCVGHEIVGEAIRVGQEVKRIRIGDRVGVGAQSGSCGACDECRSSNENLCQRGWVGTYDGTYPDGSKSYGGYGRYCRVPSTFVVRIPTEIGSAEAAPMLCAGVTTYRALTGNGAGPGKSVGVVGVGGLGHFAILWAKALQCAKVVAVSRTRTKEQLARALGADHFISTREDKWAVDNAGTLDLIISTASNADMPLSDYLAILRVGGQFIQVGEPEGTLPGINVFSLIGRDIKIGSSVIGSPAKIEEMLAFAVERHVRPRVQLKPMREANEVIQLQAAGKAEMRYVLVNED